MDLQLQTTVLPQDAVVTDSGQTPATIYCRYSDKSNTMRSFQQMSKNIRFGCMVIVECVSKRMVSTPNDLMQPSAVIRESYSTFISKRFKSASILKHVILIYRLEVYNRRYYCYILTDELQVCLVYLLTFEP